MCDSNFYETDVIGFLSGAQKGLNSFKFVRCYVLKKNTLLGTFITKPYNNTYYIHVNIF